MTPTLTLSYEDHTASMLQSFLLEPESTKDA